MAAQAVQDFIVRRVVVQVAVETMSAVVVQAVVAVVLLAQVQMADLQQVARELVHQAQAGQLASAAVVVQVGL